MLSPVIKELLEKKLGKEIRYSSDIEHLSFDIEKTTCQRVSINTLKRLLGILPTVKEPRLYTLDTVAKYIDYKNWDQLLESFSRQGNSGFNSMEEIEIENLTVGNKIAFTYSPDREVIIEFTGKNLFAVIEAKNSKLIVGDVVEVNHFVLNYPLLAVNVTRNDRSLGKFTAGKVSGLTSLRLIQD